MKKYHFVKTLSSSHLHSLRKILQEVEGFPARKTCGGRLTCSKKGLLPHLRQEAHGVMICN
jgi:hypothetical protein